MNYNAAIAKLVGLHMKNLAFSAWNGMPCACEQGLRWTCLVCGQMEHSNFKCYGGGPTIAIYYGSMAGGVLVHEKCTFQ